MPSDELPDSTEPEHDLLQQVRALLQQRGYATHRSLEISAERSVVVVHGRLPTFYQRQVAVECIKRVAGVDQVIDLIKVGDNSSQPMDPFDEPQKPSAIATKDFVLQGLGIPTS